MRSNYIFSSVQTIWIIEICIYPLSIQNKHHHPPLRGQEYQIRVLVASIETRQDNSRRLAPEIILNIP